MKFDNAEELFKKAKELYTSIPDDIIDTMDSLFELSLKEEDENNRELNDNVMQLFTYILYEMKEIKDENKRLHDAHESLMLLFAEEIDKKEMV